MALYCEEHCGTMVGLATIPVSCPTCIIESLRDELEEAKANERDYCELRDHADRETVRAEKAERSRDGWEAEYKLAERNKMDRETDLIALRVDLLGSRRRVRADRRTGVVEKMRRVRADRRTKEGWRSNMKVYVIEDEKYGTQAVFLKDEDAQKAMDSGKYNVSGGLGCAVIEFELQR